MSALNRVVDATLEATVVGSFSRVGYQVRNRLERWPAVPLPRLDGRTVLVTGATSGIGLATAVRLAELGASVRLLVRSEAKAKAACARIREAATGTRDVVYQVADMSDLQAVRDFAAAFVATNPRLDVLVHNAGALSRQYQEAPDGTELTLAAQVLGPFLLTGLLLPTLRRGEPARVVTVASGGMYTQRLDLAGLEMDRARYNGTVAYARAKRAQVVLNHEWALRVPASEAVFHAMHPGWADTPGVVSGLPSFHRVMRPLLRTADQGADTVVWLASAREALASSGDFWLDRRQRGEHRLPWTRHGDDGGKLWDFCAKRTGCDPSPTVE